jgi:hypothetical protein
MAEFDDSSDISVYKPPISNDDFFGPLEGIRVKEVGKEDETAFTDLFAEQMTVVKLFRRLG